MDMFLLFIHKYKVLSLVVKLYSFLNHFLLLFIESSSIGKLHTHTLNGFKPMTSPSIPLLWETCQLGYSSLVVASVIIMGEWSITFVVVALAIW